MNILNAEKLYFLGPEGTYAQQAMEQLVAKYDIKVEQKIPLNPITAILKTVDNDKNAFAVLPIENSIEGIVRETIDNLVKLEDENLKITAETVIPISHCLMSEAKNPSEIKYIISHPQALGQCSGYICENLKGVTVLEAASTSEAARQAKEKGKEYAAIASKIAAKKFDLNILAEQINDEKDNKTRFILLTRTPLSTTENAKTSIFFSVKNEPGSLVKVLNIFDQENINLMYIESRPSKKKMGEYNFCLDLEGHATDKNIASAIEKAEKITNRIVVTGSYPQFEP
mgnify:FL=1